MPKTELTTMVMLTDEKSGCVLVQDRIKNWKGWSFPGGHVEPNESFVDCAVREVREETGLDAHNLKACGVIHWLNTKTFDRYIVFLYKTSDFSGELLPVCDEGKNHWVPLDNLRNTPSENGAHKYLPMFLEDRYCEAFGAWSDDEPWEIVYQ